MPLPDSERLYSDDEIEDLLLKANALGFSLDEGSELTQLTIAELAKLVTVVQ